MLQWRVGHRGHEPPSRVRKTGTKGFPACGDRRARRVQPLPAMAGRGEAPPPAKRSSSGVAGRGGAAPPPAANAGRRGLAQNGQRPLAGGVGAAVAAGRGVPPGGAPPPGLAPSQPALGEGSLKPTAPASVPATNTAGRGVGRAPVAPPLVPQAAGRGGPRPPAPGTSGDGPAGRGAGHRPVGGVTATTGKPPPHYVARPVQNRSTQPQSINKEPNVPPRGQWGDDGYDAYGEGQHRGSSSTGGGYGYAWQSNGSAERPFCGPAGGFVEGAFGPDRRQRGGHRGNRGGRSWGRGRFRRPPPPRVSVPTDATEETQLSSELPPQAMEVVKGLANVEVTEAGTVDEAAERSDAERASKYARKKERMICYRCGEKGHFIAKCVAQLCESCGKLAHESGECPILRDLPPTLNIYGVYCAELMFFESPAAREVPEDNQSSTTWIVRATQGEVTEAQIVRRLQELAPGDFVWELVLIEDRVFKVDFPSVDDLQRLLSFGLCKVPGTKCILEFNEWKQVEPKGKPLTQVWLRFLGAPSKPLQDARVVASLGIMVGKTEKVDMAFTRANGIARILVSILDIEYVPDKVNWTYKGEVFPLDIEFEDTDLFDDAVNGNDVDMHDREGGAGTKGALSDETMREGSNVSHAQSAGNGLEAQPTASQAVPMTTLRFGSFEPASAPPRLWSDRVESSDDLERTLPSLELEMETGVSVARQASSLGGVAAWWHGDGSLGLQTPAGATSVSAIAGAMGCGGGGSGHGVLSLPVLRPMQVSSVASAPRGSAPAAGGTSRQAASTPSAMVVATTVAAAAGGGTPGQEARSPPSTPMVRRTISPMPFPSELPVGAGADRGQEALSYAPPHCLMWGTRPRGSGARRRLL
ncbi:uncharacterized protein [Triticum aestivum]|uniref:uncharacterized protein isoform X1 n=1 Tax=Triticum aestivum TaxID=4565 RepID=UPI000845848F|nr:uncharacterized protein LOC123044309 isoform X1 [Triticum aestivum]